MRKKAVGIRIALTFVVLVTAGLLAASAGSFTAGPLVQASGATPFGALTVCGNFPGPPPSTVYLNSEVEPWVDVNPTNPNNIVATWQQDRWSNGGARGLVVGVSFNGGATWTSVPVPSITDCTNGKFQRATDPWLSFAPNGHLYHMSLALDIDTPPNREGGFGPNAMLVSKSTDGGLTWAPPITLIEDSNPRFLNDKNSITADPTDANYVYAVWDRLQSSTGNVINPERVPGDLAFKGAAMFSRTTNRGQTWEPARILYDPGAINQTLGNQLVVLPEGTLVAFFNEILAARNDDGGLQGDQNLSLKRSPNKGTTWLPHGRPIRTNKLQARGTVSPDAGTPVRDGAFLFDVAVNPNSGTLYAVWQDARFSGFDQIAYSESTDGGSTWTAPVKINLTPANANPLRQQAFIPSVAVANGVVGVAYYDFRNDNGSGELADHWLIHCHANCSTPGNWVDEVRLTNTSFDLSQAPVARGLFLGDYVGLASAGTNFLAFFTQPHGSDRSSGFFRRVGP